MLLENFQLNAIQQLVQLLRQPGRFAVEAGQIGGDGHDLRLGTAQYCHGTVIHVQRWRCVGQRLTQRVEVLFRQDASAEHRPVSIQFSHFDVEQGSARIGILPAQVTQHGLNFFTHGTS